MGVFQGPRPDITPAQLLASVPVVCGLLAAFGVWSPTPEQEDALELAMGWAVALIFGDAGLRAARGFSTAKQEAVAKLPSPASPATALPPPPEGTVYVAVPSSPPPP